MTKNDSLPAIKQNAVIIVDPLSSGALIAEELKKYDTASVAIISQPNLTHFLLESYQKEDFIDEWVVDENIDLIMLEIAAKYNVIAVIAGAESGVLLADKLGIQFNTISNDLSKSQLRRNKFLMQQALRQQNLTHIPSYITASAEEAVMWAEAQLDNNRCKSGYIAKPVQSGGTDGVYYCSDISELRRAFNDLLGTKDVFNNDNNQVLTQCFMEGQEYVVDTMSIDGTHILTGLLKYNKTKTPSGNLIYNYMDFIEQSGSIEKEIIAYAKQVLTVLGVENGPAHTEVMYTPTGPVLIETGARMHGGSNPLYAEACSDNSQLKMIPKVYLPTFKKQYYSEVINYDYKLKRHMRVVFLIAPFPSLIHNIMQFAHKVQMLHSYFDAHLPNSPQVVPQTIDLTTCPGFIVLMGDPEEIKKDTEAIRQLELKLYNIARNS